MLQHSFIHLPGVGEQTEQKLWDQGVHDWDALCEYAPEAFGPKKAGLICEALEESKAAFEAQEFRYFHERLKGCHTWRLVPECSDSIAYLDIETTGLGFPPVSHSTTIAVSFRGELFVEHDHEKKRQLIERIESEAQLLVTFNGASFDLPFLRREFGLALLNPHVDLRMWFRRLGYAGGLKKIQAGFSEVRSRSSMDIDGYDAVKLWRMHRRGLDGALETLMTYNAEDAVCLEPLLHLAYRMERERLLHLPCRDLVAMRVPEITTQIHSHIYDLLRGAHYAPEYS